jgi:hypothetical protein
MTGIFHKTLDDGSSAYFWLDVLDGMTKEEALERQAWHGPFATIIAAAVDRESVLLEPRWHSALEIVQ